MLKTGNRQMWRLIFRLPGAVGKTLGLLGRRGASAALVMLLAASYTTPAAHAAIFEDQLKACMAGAIKPSDRPLLVQWIFDIVSLNPAVRSQATVTDAQRAANEKKIEALFSRLLTDNCRHQALVALKFEEVPNVLPPSFQLLSDLALRALLNQPEVANGVSKIKDYMKDDDNLNKLIHESASFTDLPGK
jgi:hypothetical protein